MRSALTRFIVILCMALPLQSFSQWAIHMSRPAVKKHLEKQLAKNDTLHILLDETDTSLHYSIRDPKVLHADFIYTFGEDGKCNSEKAIASCDSCFTKYLQSALRDNRYQWKKLNDHLYISSFSKRLMLEIPVNNTDHTYFIRRMNWTRESYRTLVRSK